jgi:hypothetical protein
MGIDDESNHPGSCSEVADGVTHTIVCLFREPDALCGLPIYVVLNSQGFEFPSAASRCA